MAPCIVPTAHAQEEAERPHVVRIEESIGILGDLECALQCIENAETADAFVKEITKLHKSLTENLAAARKMGIPSNQEKARLKNTLYKDRLGEVKEMLKNIDGYISDLKAKNYHDSEKLRAAIEKLIPDCKELAKVTQEQSI